jgi:ADP-ribosyl-[dinitrogen reductase] hydrolase
VSSHRDPTIPTASLVGVPSGFTSLQRQRFVGIVVGAAVGDALGAPFEFGPAGQYSKRFPSPVLGGIGEMVGGGGFNWAPGEFTDDTQMALAMALTLVDAGGYAPDALWTAWRCWASDAADVGNTTRASLRFPDWRNVTHRDPENTAANGALMRVFPLAVALAHATDDEARAVVLHQAALTHPHPAAGWGAWLAVAMMRAAVHGADPFAVLEQELGALPDTIAQRFSDTLGPTWAPNQPHAGNGSVWGCLAEAVWAVRSTDSFDAAVIAAIELGGDTDTVACVAGALAGAIYGVQAIPSRWVTYLHGTVSTPAGVRRFDAGDLQNIALQLAGVNVKAEQAPEPPAAPVAVAERLYAANLMGAANAPDGHATVSLCRTGERFTNRPVRRHVYLVDKLGDHNAALAVAVHDAVASIDALLAEGHHVVVHCFGGRSRTGLVLKAWKMRTDGCSEAEAHDWLEERWPLYVRSNPTFTEFLRTEWATS